MICFCFQNVSRECGSISSYVAPPQSTPLHRSYLPNSFQLSNSSSENDPPIWPSGGAQMPQKLKNLFDPFDGVQNLKPVGEEVWFYNKLSVTYSSIYKCIWTSTYYFKGINATYVCSGNDLGLSLEYNKVHAIFHSICV